MDIMANIENTKAQMRKGILEYCTLLILDTGEFYPSDLIEKLKQGKMIVVEGTLYPLLTRLKNDGLLTYRWEESKMGPPRKYYSITPFGQQILLELDSTWHDMSKSIETIRKTNKSS